MGSLRSRTAALAVLILIGVAFHVNPRRPGAVALFGDSDFEAVSPSGWLEILFGCAAETCRAVSKKMHKRNNSSTFHNYKWQFDFASLQDDGASSPNDKKGSKVQEVVWCFHDPLNCSIARCRFCPFHHGLTLPLNLFQHFARFIFELMPMAFSAWQKENHRFLLHLGIHMWNAVSGSLWDFTCVCLISRQFFLPSMWCLFVTGEFIHTFTFLDDVCEHACNILDLRISKILLLHARFLARNVFSSMNDDISSWHGWLSIIDGMHVRASKLLRKAPLHIYVCCTQDNPLCLWLPGSGVYPRVWWLAPSMKSYFVAVVRHLSGTYTERARWVRINCTCMLAAWCTWHIRS